jgi:hypothetical protein
VSHEPSQRLPRGELRTTEGGVQVRLLASREEREGIDRLVERFRRLDAAHFLVPRSVEWDGEGVLLRYPAEHASVMALEEALGAWENERAAHVPLFLELARFLDTCGRELAKAELGAFAFAPIHVRYTPGVHGVFRVLLFPLPPVELEDWARASEAAWAWLTPRALLREDPRGAQAHSIGAALYRCLVAPSPEGLSAAERFERVIHGRSFSRSRLDAALDGLLPRGLADERRDLVAWLTAVLEDGDAGEAWREKLVSLHERLSPHRLAARWEYERQSTLARRVLELAAPDRAIPWDGLARLRAREGEWAGAIEASLSAIAESPEVPLVFDALALVRHVPDAKSRALSAARVVAAIDERLARGGIHPLGVEEIRLHLADLELRVLGDVAAGRARLDVRFAVPWHQALRSVMLAYAYTRAGDHVRASKASAEGRALVASMANDGGAPGRWASAYLSYLEGIANFGAVAAFSDTSYLADAYEAFARSIDGAIEAYGGADPLVEAGAHWLRWLVAFATQTGAPNLAAVKLGADAYLRARKLRFFVPDAAPLLMIYDAAVLLPLSQRV